MHRAYATDSSLFEELSEIILILSLPLSDEEEKNGWSGQIKGKWKSWFEALLHQLSNGVPVPTMHIARGLDFDGIGNGYIVTLAASISNRMNDGEALVPSEKS